MELYSPTGNEYLALPTLRQRDGALETLNVTLMRLDGLLELEGTPERPLLSSPAWTADAGAWHWHFEEDWLPVCTHRGDATRTGHVLAPPGERFFIYRAPAAPNAGETRFHLHVARILQTINTRAPLPAWTCRIGPFNWASRHGVVIEIYAGTLLLTLGLRAEDAAEYRCQANGAWHGLNDGDAAVETSGPFGLEIVTRGEPQLTLGMGLNNVGARSADLQTARVPAATWHAQAVDWLRRRRVEIPGDPGLSTCANRNGHFARFFAMARTLDSGQTVSMTSRSHRYYVSSAYWDRDSLLWLYPFLLRNDPEHALELLRYAFGPQLANAGIHSRQISGQILEYGFELDELVAPLIALGSWQALHTDRDLLQEGLFRDGMLGLLERLEAWRHPGAALYRTELMPTDDHLKEGRDILTYDNALVLHAWRLLLPGLRRVAPRWAAVAEQRLEEMPIDIARHLVHDGCYQWATDLRGHHEFYDEAPGSLTLLSYHGFCTHDAPIYRKTLARLYSPAYPFALPGRFSELGNRHTGTPHPWVLSACNSILSGARVAEGLAFLREAPMDGRIACESVNVETGLPETGLHFGTCAGFVAHAITTAARLYPELVGKAPR